MTPTADDRRAGRLGTGPSVIRADQQRPRLGLRKQIKVESRGEDGSLIVRKSIFSLIVANPITSKICFNQKHHFSRSCHLEVEAVKLVIMDPTTSTSFLFVARFFLNTLNPEIAGFHVLLN